MILFCSFVNIVLQIKLLQGAANAYNIPADSAFDRWFESILVLDDREAYELSCQIEPSGPSTGGTAKEHKYKKRAG